MQRVIPSASGRVNDTLENRTLLLSVPEVGSSRVGFLSKRADSWAEVDGKSGNYGSNDDDSSAGSSVDVSNCNFEFVFYLSLTI